MRLVGMHLLLLQICSTTFPSITCSCLELSEERILIELMTWDRKLKASREGSK